VIVPDDPDGAEDTPLPAASDQALAGRVPPPSPELLARVVRARAVRTRRPFATLCAVALLSLLWTAGVLLLVVGLRPDLDLLPVGPLALYLVVCGAGFVVQLAFVLVPSPGRVLPSGYASARHSLLVAGITVPLTIVVGAAAGGAPGSWAGAPFFWRATLVCLGRGGAVAALPIVLGVWALRRVLPGGSWRTSLALGAAAGTLAGTALELGCPEVALAHLALAHGSAALCPAVLLMLVLRQRR
jgi:hypothetical protein